MRSRIIKTIISKEFVAEYSNRSESDNGVYVNLVKQATNNYKVFNSFKRHPNYRAILEHVTKKECNKYLEILKNQSPEFLD